MTCAHTRLQEVTFYVGPGDDPFICGVSADFCIETLQEIQEQYREEAPPPALPAGTCTATYAVSRQPDQVGDEGRVEMLGYWDLDLIRTTTDDDEANRIGNG